jgi:hypothetical protein
MQVDDGNYRNLAGEEVHDGDQVVEQDQKDRVETESATESPMRKDDHSIGGQEK